MRCSNLLTIVMFSDKSISVVPTVASLFPLSPLAAPLCGSCVTVLVLPQKLAAFAGSRLAVAPLPPVGCHSDVQLIELYTESRWQSHMTQRSDAESATKRGTGERRTQEKNYLKSKRNTKKKTEKIKQINSSDLVEKERE